MRPLVEALIPGVHVVTRPRLSNLFYAGEKKISRLPPRSAIVAFSVEEVYAIAEVIRRQRGGAAVVLGAGLLILIYRRRTSGPVFRATTRMDKTMYVFLAASILLGSWATVQTQLLADGLGYDYRQTISPWFRSLWYLQPQPELMAGVPAAFQLHIVAANLLFILWPFTRLVHAFSAPVPYLFRPYVVYRSRDASVAARAPRPGWDPSERPRSR